MTMNQLSCLVLATALAVAQGAGTKCAFLPAAEAPPVEMELPVSSLSHPLMDLKLEFRGVSPMVTRQTIGYGETPKVIVKRYSTEPTVVYDEAEGKVIVSADTCGTVLVGGSGAAAAACTSWLPLAGASLMAGVLGGPVAAAGVAATGLMPQAMADTTCEPVVQVMVQAPSSYMGVRETCLAEIADDEICPEPFPTYPTCDDPAPSCGLAVVGGGAGGLYTALRMLDEGAVEGSDICVFDMTERVGGRLMSLRGLGPDGDLTVDAGGYRTWPEFTPTAHALITEYLGIPMDCYDDSDPCQVYNIVDENGKKAGFALFVEEMMQRLSDAGACWFPYHELTSFAKVAGASGDVTELHFNNGVTATATMTTILNLPQRPLLEVVRNSDLDAKGILDFSTLDALHSVQTVIATKLYLYYPKGSVWWHQLGLFSGDFETSGDARSMLLAGRYHDGQVECDDDNDISTCHGFLLAVYANDLSGNKAQFFRRYQRERQEPVTIIANNDLEGREFLRHAHERLVEYHVNDPNEAIDLPPFQVRSVLDSSALPEYAILSNWNTAIPWAGGAWHTWTDLSNIGVAKQPFVDDNIFVVNEAYSLLHGWAEGSLKVGDEILEQFFDIPRPWDFPVIDLNQVVLQTSSEECVEADSGGASSGGGGDTGGGGSGGGDAGGVLCFRGDALVHMADGTFKPIQDVVQGDVVLTGTGQGAGRVTELLVHPVPRGQAVLTTLTTSVGDLVGTPDHPILDQDGQWVDFSQMSISDDENVLLRTEVQSIDVLYNLEIDGDDVEGSSHSYMVNGVVASGLGDNEVLNMRFPRQDAFKEMAAAAAA